MERCEPNRYKRKSQIRTGTSQNRISYTYIDCFLNILCWPSKPSQALLPKLSSWRWGQIQIAFSFFGWKFGNFLGRLSRWNFLGGVEPSRWNFLLKLLGGISLVEFSRWKLLGGISLVELSRWKLLGGISLLEPSRGNFLGGTF